MPALDLSLGLGMIGCPAHMLDAFVLKPPGQIARHGEAAGRSLFPCFPQVDADAMVWLRSPHAPSRASLHLGSRSDAGRHICPATSSAFHLLSRVDGGDISALRCG